MLGTIVRNLARGMSTRQLTAAEERMTQMLKKSIDGCTVVEVTDVSNGCGSMYDVYVEAKAFKGMSRVAQHKLVTGVLRQEIEDMHGLTIKTKCL